MVTKADPWVGSTMKTVPIAVATLTKELVFSLPRALERHPGVEVPARGGRKEGGVCVGGGGGRPAEGLRGEVGVHLWPASS